MDIVIRSYEENTEGVLLLGTAGIQLFYRDFQFEAMYQYTLTNHLDGTQQLDAKNRLQIGVNYLFN